MAIMQPQLCHFDYRFQSANAVAKQITAEEMPCKLLFAPGENMRHKSNK